MVHELAEFENAADECTVTESKMHTALFADPPTAYAHVAEVDGEAAACALWFTNFSTWDGVAGIYLEDLFVRPQFRRHGLARALLATLARECVDGGYTRLSWAVLDWNVNAIALYDSVGGAPAERVDHLPGLRPRVVRPRRILSGARRRPLQRRRAEQQSQCANCHECDGYAIGPLLRADGDVPGDRQQEQLREHRDAPAPSPARPQRPSGGEQGRTHDRVPDRGAVPADRLLVGAADGPHHQDRGHDDERDALERHHDARLTHGCRRGNDHDGQRRGSTLGSCPVRAVLIVNPNATSTTPAGRDLLAHALESRVSLTVAHTDHRGHAIEIARDAARDGIDVVIVHGGDGTVNEVVNGILGDCGQDGPFGRGPRSRWSGRFGQRVRPGVGNQPRPDRGD